MTDDKLRSLELVEKLIEMAGEAAPGSDGLLFYPYMLGERRRENTTSRGGFYGITLNHSAPHFVRAVMEGVALAFGKDLALFSELGSGAKRILCVGGGTRNELWNRIKADVARMPLELSDEPEAGLKGAALLAAATTSAAPPRSSSTIEANASFLVVGAEISSRPAFMQQAVLVARIP